MRLIPPRSPSLTSPPKPPLERMPSKTDWQKMHIFEERRAEAERHAQIEEALASLGEKSKMEKNTYDATATDSAL